MISRTPLQQSIANHIKVARKAIRLKYEIMADEELNRALPAIVDHLEALAQKGELPSISAGELVQIAAEMEAAV